MKSGSCTRQPVEGCLADQAEDPRHASQSIQSSEVSTLCVVFALILMHASA